MAKGKDMKKPSAKQVDISKLPPHLRRQEEARLAAAGGTASAK